MDILKLAHRLTSADHYIQQETTGTPKELAAKLDISESHLYELLDVLKQLGGPIAYSRSRGTYLYTHPVTLKLGYEVPQNTQ
jgi:predicted DNA-binding transcriptional regulator YafY